MFETITVFVIGCSSFVAGCFGYHLCKKCSNRLSGKDLDSFNQVNLNSCEKDVERTEKRAAKVKPSSVLFFPDRELLCDSIYRKIIKPSSTFTHPCNRSNCNFLHENDKSSLKELLMILNGANESVDVCMFKLTHHMLSNMLIHLKTKKGVRVRVIAHSDRLDHDDSKNKIPELRNAGIPIKLKTLVPVAEKNPPEALMHHKFCIIDRETLILGSFNWTYQAVMKNNESVSITSHRRQVAIYANQFDTLWENMQ